QFEGTDGRSFGGLGMMIDRPRVEVQLAPAREWLVEGLEADRARRHAQQALGLIEAPNKPPALHVKVAAHIPLHPGLGGGTQLALAVAAGVRMLTGLHAGDAADLARLTGRGLRSAVGSHGFASGGLIWERGRSAGEDLAPLSARVPLPGHWRVVLLMPESG